MVEESLTPPFIRICTKRSHVTFTAIKEQLWPQTVIVEVQRSGLIICPSLQARDEKGLCAFEVVSPPLWTSLSLSVDTFKRRDISDLERCDKNKLQVRYNSKRMDTCGRI